MIPLGDDLRRSRVPWATLLLLVANLAVFAALLLQPRADAAETVARWAVVPARLAPALGGDPRAMPLLGTLLTSLFLHAGVLHLAGNLVFLWAFGRTVEDEMGAGAFVGFFALCGALGGLVHALVHPASAVPTVGASGAISGVMGAYLGLRPRARVKSVVLLLVWPVRLELPAGAWLLGWLLLQLLSGVRALAVGGGRLGAAGVAFWAHVGGFTAGLLLHRFFVARRAARPRLQAARRL